MVDKEDLLNIYVKEINEIKEAGLYKGESPITSPQGVKVTLKDGSTVINMCANNYLGLANNSRIIAAAKKSYDEKGYGLSSVRFICGTQDIHKDLEQTISRF
ncbi:MAG: glycine C-acetyltransferase, partial [Mobilitalea sp.]